MSEELELSGAELPSVGVADIVTAKLELPVADLSVAVVADVASVHCRAGTPSNGATWCRSC